MFRTLAIKLWYWFFPVPFEDHRFDYTTQEINDMRASIIPLDDGRFGLVGRTGLVKAYTRRRDAVRGANRLGLVLA